MKSLPFYFDFISPFAYLGFKQIGALAARHNRVVEPMPILFAALLDHHGHLGPAEIPPKREYVFKNALRLAYDANVPLTPPPAHPFNPLIALRVAGLITDPAERFRAIDALFDATWAGGPGVDDPARVAEVLDQAGLDGNQLVARARQPAVKESLKTRTATAIERGVFGVPTIDADGELFWGCDAFSHLERFLAGEDPISQESLERWRDLPARAARKKAPPR